MNDRATAGITAPAVTMTLLRQYRAKSLSTTRR